MGEAIFPERIVCLTEEPTEVLYALGEQRRIVGISGFTAALTEGLDALHRIIATWSLRREATG